MPRPLYDVLLICHVAAAFLGFGSIAVGGYMASFGRRSPSPFAEERLRRFFRPGVDWPGRLIFLVPLLGLSLLLGGDWPDVSATWPWLGLGLWLAAAAVITAKGWPAERRAQRAMSASTEAGEDETAFKSACAEMERSAAVVSICFVAALALMVLQP